MVKRLILLLISTIILFSCSDSKIKIEGTITDPAYENKQVYLYVITTDSSFVPQMVKSVAISNYKFQFDNLDQLLEGKMPAMGILSVGETLENLSNDYLAMALILEEGNIEVSFDEKAGSVGGTSRNEELNREHVARTKLYNLVMSINDYSELENVEPNEDGEDGNAQLQNLDRDIKDLRYSFTRDNMSNNIGQYLFWKSYTEKMFTPNQVLNLIELGTDEFKMQNGVKVLQETLGDKYLGTINADSLQKNDTNLE